MQAMAGARGMRQGALRACVLRAVVAHRVQEAGQRSAHQRDKRGVCQCVEGILKPVVPKHGGLRRRPRFKALRGAQGSPAPFFEPGAPGACRRAWP